MRAPLPAPDPATAPDDPLDLFRAWFTAAREAVPEPEAATLATATPDGRPSARMVLVRGADADGFVFFTSYRGRKARELDSNPRAALVFHWAPLARQLRIEGRVARTDAAVSDAYFRARPVGSRLSAIASPQSEVVPDRAWLEARVAEATLAHRHGEIPRPADWGGYRVAPDAIEFWQGGEHRLHDRLRYRREGVGWRRERLAP